MADRSQRRKDAALVLSLAGPWLMLLPVFIRLGDSGEVFYVPAIVVYVFGIWLSLIVATWWIGRGLRETAFPDHGGPDAGLGEAAEYGPAGRGGPRP